MCFKCNVFDKKGFFVSQHLVNLQLCSYISLILRYNKVNVAIPKIDSLL